MARKANDRRELRRGVVFGFGSAVGGAAAALALLWLLSWWVPAEGDDGDVTLAVQSGDGDGGGCWP